MCLLYVQVEGASQRKGKQVELFKLTSLGARNRSTLSRALACSKRPISLASPLIITEFVEEMKVRGS